LSKLAVQARAKKAAKAASEPAVTTKPKKEPRVVNLDDPDDVQVEDVDEEDNEGENELTENTPEDRVKVIVLPSFPLFK
jgi:hypothetical protein